MKYPPFHPPYILWRPAAICFGSDGLSFPLRAGQGSMVGGSVTNIMLRSSRPSHQRERLTHGFSYGAATLSFIDGDVVRRDFTAMAISKNPTTPTTILEVSR